MMKMLYDEYRDLGIKLTPQRLAILECLKGNKQHPSAEDIYRSVSQKFPTMSFATVYNTLEALRQRGRLLALTIDPDKKRFDPVTRPHHHLLCLTCGRIADIHADFQLLVTDSQKDGFTITGNHIEFYGYCLECGEGKTIK